MHQRGSQIEILAEPIGHVESEKSLALGGEEALVFERHRHILPRIDDALIGDGDYAESVVNGVVGVFG